MSSQISESGKKGKITPLGRRFLRAFIDALDLTDKRRIAELIGYKSEKAIYKIVNGEQEMTFDALIRFRRETDQSIDWLLTGEKLGLQTASNLSVDATAETLAEHFYEYPLDMDLFVVSLAKAFPEFRKMLHDLAFRRAEKVAEIVGRATDLLEDDEIPVHNLGTADEFDLSVALERDDNPQAVMSEWFAFEKRERDYPEDYGVVFFQGWETFSVAEKIEALQDAKRLLDRSLKEGEV